MALKYNSHEDAEKAYEDAQKKISQQGEELGQLRTKAEKYESFGKMLEKAGVSLGDATDMIKDGGKSSVEFNNLSGAILDEYRKKGKLSTETKNKAKLMLTESLGLQDLFGKDGIEIAGGMVDTIMGRIEGNKVKVADLIKDIVSDDSIDVEKMMEWANSDDSPYEAEEYDTFQKLADKGKTQVFNMVASDFKKWMDRNPDKRSKYEKPVADDAAEETGERTDVPEPTDQATDTGETKMPDNAKRGVPTPEQIKPGSNVKPYNNIDDFQRDASELDGTDQAATQRVMERAAHPESDPRIGKYLEGGKNAQDMTINTA